MEGVQQGILNLMGGGGKPRSASPYNF